MVSIIILSYNTADLLERCLRSLFTHINPKTYEVIVFDNGSSDGTVKEISNFKFQISNFQVIANKENLGFGKGVNAAIKYAKGEYVLFLNSDTEIIDNSFEELVKLIRSDPKIAIAGGYLEETGSTTSRSFGPFYGIWDVFLMLFGAEGFKKNTAVPKKPLEVDWVSGGFMMVRKDIFTKVGGFDPYFFMYIEDMELCYRVKKQGYTIYFQPHARVKHVGQGSSNRGFAIIHIYKGLLYFYKKHKPPWQYVLIKCMLIGKGIFAVFIGTLSGNEYLKKTYLQALRYSI